MAANPKQSVPRKKATRRRKNIPSQTAENPIRLAVRISRVCASATAKPARHERLTAQMLMETPRSSVNPQRTNQSSPRAASVRCLDQRTVAAAQYDTSARNTCAKLAHHRAMYALLACSEILSSKPDGAS
jgi:hypothetical protein